jgi:hypothetical protein
MWDGQYQAIAIKFRAPDRDVAYVACAREQRGNARVLLENQKGHILLVRASNICNIAPQRTGISSASWNIQT